MSYNTSGTFTAGQCVDVLQDLTDIEGNIHSPLMKQTPTGYIEALNSPLNDEGVEKIQIQDGSGKKRSVRIRYMQRVIETQVDDAITRSCSEGDFRDFNETNFDCDHVLEHRESLNETDFQRICDGQTDFANMLLRSSFDAMARTINRDALTEQSTNFGVNLGNGGLTTAKDVNVLQASDGAPLAVGLQEIDSDYKVSNQMTGTPILVGAGNIYKYWRTLQAGCCNDGGIDMLALSNQLGFSPFVDTMIDGVLGTNHFAVLEPGTVHFVPFNEYVGERRKDIDNLQANTLITDPRRNITYDLKILFDRCTDNWTWIFRLCYGFFFRPGDSWHPDDPLDNVNGTLRYRAQTT